VAYMWGGRLSSRLWYSIGFRQMSQKWRPLNSMLGLQVCFSTVLAVMVVLDMVPEMSFVLC